MTLHEAIEIVLKEKNQALPAKEIADIINDRKLYRRGDGNPVPSSQIHARVKNYPNLFYKENGVIGLRENSLRLRHMLIQRVPDIPEIILEIRDYLINKIGNRIELILLTVEWVLAFVYIDLDIRPNDEDHSPDHDEVFFKIKNYNDSSLNKIFNHLLRRKELIDHKLLFNSYKIELVIDRKDKKNVFSSLANFIKNSLIDLRESGQYSTPDFINKLLVKIVNPKEGEIVYDPACGIGNTLINVYKFNNDVIIKGQEPINYVAEFAKINLVVNNISDFSITVDDAIKNPCVKKDSADCIISNPPLGGKMNDINDLDFRRLCKDKSLDSLFFEMMLSRLNNKTGRMAIVVPDSFLFRSNNIGLKKHIVETNLLEAVIALPKRSLKPYTGVNASIIVLNNNKEEERKNKVLFIDTRNSIELKLKNQEVNIPRNELDIFVEQVANIYFRSFSVNEHINFELTDDDKISELNYDLTVERYTSGVLETIEKIEKQENLIKLRDVLNNIDSLSLNEKNNNEDIKIVNLNDLNENAFDFYLDINKLKTIAEPKKSYKIVSASALLVAKVGSSLKPTFFKYKNQPIAVNFNILVFSVNKKIIPEYLISQTDTEFFNSQYNLMIRGDGILFLRRNDFLEIKIPLLSIREQREEVSRYKKEQANRFKLTRFINDIRLVSNQEEIKEEIERFAKTIFTDSEHILYRSEFEFEKFPFSQSEIEQGFAISQELFENKEEDGISYTNILLIGENNRINGVLTVDTENNISSEQYSEINAYADFLIKTREYISNELASDNLAKFAHTSKNFFLRLSGEIDSIVNTKNERLKSVFAKEFVESDAIINRKKKQGKEINDYLLSEKLNRIENQINAISKFYFTTDLNFKEISSSENSNFDVLPILNECILAVGDVEFNYKGGSIKVNSKLAIIKQSIIDLLQNAISYSPDNKGNISIKEFETYIAIEIENKIDDIIPEETYKKLGKNWLTGQNNVGISKGLYWAREGIENSNGILILLPYDEYKTKKIFKVVIKLKKQI